MLLTVALVVVETVNLGAVVLTAVGAQRALAHVHSLNQLVASSPIAPGARQLARPVPPGIQEVVLGDSTAAGAGLAPVADPSPVDRACGRSSDSYAEDLARANGWRAMNLACDSATISQGLLGTQVQGGIPIAAQIAAVSQVQSARVVIVSVGADDLRWSAMVEYCAAARQCDNRASAAYIEQKLAAFSTDYLHVLIRLGSLPGHPEVIVNRYYDPFGGNIGCLTGRGLTAAKVRALSGWLTTLNKVLAKGAAQFGFLSPQPSFAGHQLCSAQPYVQGPDASAPFHPTELGQLAIALADQVALGGSPAADAPAAAQR